MRVKMKEQMGQMVSLKRPKLVNRKVRCTNLCVFRARLFAVITEILFMATNERRQLQQRAVGVAAAAAAAAYGAPQIATHVSEQKEEEAFLKQAADLAEALNEELNGGEVINSIDISKPWSHQVNYVPGETADAMRPGQVQAFVDLFSDANSRKSLADAVEQRKTHDCMSEAIYYEARSESLEGQLAVAEVVLNRVKSDYYPDDVCGVVYQGSTRRTGCQFSFTCDGSMKRRATGKSWDAAKAVAANVLIGWHDKPVTGGATHYHTDYVNPYWNSHLIRTNKIGAHIFYRNPETRQEWAIVKARHIELARAKAKAEARPEPTPIERVSLTTADLMAAELRRFTDV